jgi:DNA-binding transcriptional ArsR family regulator
MSGPFEALGDVTRRQILVLLSDGERLAGAIVTAVQQEADISQPAVSQHLKVLREAGLVTARAHGAHRIYSLDEAGIEHVRHWLAHLVEPLPEFEQSLDALETEVARGKRERRGGTRRSQRSKRADGRAA